MFLSNGTTLRSVRKTPGRPVTCSRCNNATVQPVVWWDASFHLEFMGAHVLGRKAYGYVCMICKEVSDTLTKSQVKALRG